MHVRYIQITEAVELKVLFRVVPGISLMIENVPVAFNRSQLDYVFAMCNNPAEMQFRLEALKMSTIITHVATNVRLY